MARYRKIDPRLWKDERVRALPLEDKAIVVYILTAQSNRIGLFNFSPSLAAEDLDLPSGTFAKRFANVCLTMEWTFDEGSRTLWIPRWWRYNRPENPNNLIGNLSDIADLPKTPLLQRFLDNLDDLGDLGPLLIETFGKRYPKRMATQEQEQEQEQENKNPPLSPRKRGAAWRRRPETETLTLERQAAASACGLDPSRHVREWAKFGDHEFAKPKRDVDATWRNWCRTAAESTPPGSRPSGAVPIRTPEQQAVFEANEASAAEELAARRRDREALWQRQSVAK